MAITITKIITVMAIRNEARGDRMAAAYFLARGFIWLLGLGAVAWGGFVLPLFWQQATLDRVATELLQGHNFKMQFLLDEAQQAEAAERSSFCNPTELRDVVILRLSILNQAIAATNRTLVEAGYAPLYAASHRALACSPADPFVWLTLFWLDAGKGGFTSENAGYLRLSYALGPNEGWIALWRVRLALALFARLPTDLSNDAIDDFIKLVNTGHLYSETAAIFASAAPAAQSRIVAQLKTAKPIPREIFAKTLYDRGVDVNVPGVDKPEHPWQW